MSEQSHITNHVQYQFQYLNEALCCFHYNILSCHSELWTPNVLDDSVYCGYLFLMLLSYLHCADLTGWPPPAFVYASVSQL